MTDLTTEAVDAIEKVVGAVRERTVVPANRVTRLDRVRLPRLVLRRRRARCSSSSATFRAANVYLAKERVWAVWTVLGGIFVLAGASSG